MPETISARRRARERQQIRDRILDAARELFAAEGYDAVTMRRVAERIEYTPPVIYQHFSDKAAACADVAAAGFPYHTFVEAPFYFQNLTGALAPQPQPDGTKAWTLPIDPAARGT